MSNELTTLQNLDEKLPVVRAPEQILDEAKRAAKALADVISKKAKPVIFNGEQYLEYEDWQTVGRFYSVAARTKDAVPTEIDGIKGAKALAEIVDVRTGAVLGSAEAYCLRDEKNWKDKPWFQLASMAQTRAGAKAFRNILSWVVVLAGYKTTPAEEIESMEVAETKTPAKNLPAMETDRPLPPSGRVISDPQRKRLYAIWKSAGKTDDEVHAFISDRYGIASTKEITVDIYEEICTWAAAKPQ